MKVKKLLAVILTAAILLGLCACKEKNSPRPSNYVIGEDDPWYLKTEVPMNSMYFGNGFTGSNLFSNMIDDQLLVMVSGTGITDDGDYREAIRLGLYRMSGMMSGETTFLADEDVNSINVIGGYRETEDEIAVLFIDNYFMTSNSSLYKIIWNTKTNTVSDPEVLPVDIPDNTYSLFRAHTGDYTVIQDVPYYLDEVPETVGNIKLRILDKDEVIKTIDLTELNCPGFNGESLEEEDGKLIIYGSLWEDAKGYSTFSTITYDIGSGEIVYTDESSNMPVHALKSGEHYFTIKKDGVYMDGELFLSFIDYGLNLNGYTDMYPTAELLSASEDQVVLIANTGEIEVTSSGTTVIYGIESRSLIKFDKVPQNPNAGKTVINAMSLTMPDDMLLSGIIDYNEGDNDYFIKCRVMDIDGDEPGSIESMKLRYDDIVSEITSDNGPDIVFGAHILPELNDDLFMNLKSKVKLSKREFFTNISDMCKVNGKLYYIPLTYSIKGIFVKEDSLDKERVGFTYEEYEKIVEEKWGGEDPTYLYGTRDDYISQYLNSLSRPIDKKGNLDVDQESFKEALEFIKDNTPDEEVSVDLESLYSYYVMNEPPAFIHAVMENCINYSSYTRYTANYPDLSFCGMPSYNGSGPAATIDTSVAICAKTGMKGACIEFIYSLLEPGILLGSDHFSISKDTESIRLSSSFQNDMRSNGLEFARKKYKQNPSYEGYTVEGDAESGMVDLIEGVGSVSFDNPLYTDIVFRHTELYMSGDKDLDQTVSDINAELAQYFG